MLGAVHIPLTRLHHYGLCRLSLSQCSPRQIMQGFSAPGKSGRMENTLFLCPECVCLIPNPATPCRAQWLCPQAAPCLGSAVPYLPRDAGTPTPWPAQGASHSTGCPRDALYTGGLVCLQLNAMLSLGCCHCWVALLGPQGRMELPLSRNHGSPVPWHYISLHNLLKHPWGRDCFLPKPGVPSWPTHNLAKGEPAAC